MSTVTDASTEVGSGVPASPPKENLYRAASCGLELIRADGQEMPTLRGHFSVFDTWTEINSIFEGNFLERIAPGAFSKTIAEGRDQMRVMFQHGQDPQIGEKVLGPIQTLREDGTGAYYEVPLLDTSYNRDLIPGLEAGLYGASFRFRVMKEEFVAKPSRSKGNPDGLPERTITEAQVREFGPVVWGAYPTATAGLRSLTDEFILGRFAADTERLAELVEALIKSRTQPEPSEATTATEVHAPGLSPHRIFETTFVATTNTTSGGGGGFVNNVEPIRASEPEPSEATTHSNRDRLWWFTENPALKRSK